MIDTLEAQWEAPSNVKTLVSTRCGGVSAAPWASLNLGDHVGDEPQAVRENRRRLAALLPSEPVWLHQVHGTRCIDVASVAGALDADAGVTRMPAVVCAVLSADCLPVLLCDASGSVVAAAHAGWRGLASGVLEATVHAMAAMGANAASLLAWIGPAIGPRAFEVGHDVHDTFVTRDAGAAAAFVPQGHDKFLCNMPALARLRLQAAGVRRITSADLCTFGDPERFFSYRRDGVTGRMASCIWLA